MNTRRLLQNLGALALFLSLVAPRNAAAQTWTSLGPAIEPLYESPNFLLNGKIYVVGGFINTLLDSTNRVDVYDPASATWTHLTDIPIPAGAPAGLTHLGLALDRDRYIWIAGGFPGRDPGLPVLANVWKYDLVANTWTAGPSLPAARGGGGLARIGRELHYMGGTMSDRDTDAGDHWVLNLDAASPSWVTAPALPTPRTHFSTVVLNGKIYTLGGQHHHDVNPFDVSLVEVYDPLTQTWSTAASLPTVRSHFEPGTFLRDGRIIAAGGKSEPSPGNRTELDAITEYDPLTNQWTNLSFSLPTALRAPIAKIVGSKMLIIGGGVVNGFTPTDVGYVATLPASSGSWTSMASLSPGRAEIGVTAARGKVYVVGGNASEVLLNTVSVFDPFTNSWSTIAPIPGPARDHIGAATVDDKVYAIGGLTNWPGPSVSNVYMYDPLNAAAGWVAKASVPGTRGAAGVAAIGPKIYVAGGLANSAAVNELLVYDTVADSWATLAPMAIKRDHLTAQAIDGKFYAIGGRDTAIDATTNSTAMYNPATNTWTEKAAMPSPRGSVESGALIGRIYVYGADTGTSALALNQEYDPATDSWRTVTPMITARSSTGGAVISGRIFAPGGKGTDGVHNLTVNEVFTLGSAGVNLAPVVNAGLDKAIILPTTSVALAGTVTDDALPVGATVTYAWTAISGPASVAFSAPSSLSTNATFTSAGTYTLRLTANDSLLSSSDDVTVTVGAAGSFTPIRINAGGPSFTDSTGQVWSADKNFSGGGVYSTAASIAATVEDTLYRTERTGTTDQPGAAFSYNIPVPSGTYAVTLAFADIYWTTSGKRLFNVTIEGQQVLTNLDLVAVAGPNTALNYTFQTPVTDGTLNIAFTTVLDNAKVSAIQVLAVQSGGGGGGNAAPVVDAGQDQTITLPTNSVSLAGSATDDNLPAPPVPLTYAWSVVTGPASVTFSAPTSPSTTATFSTAGTYTLRLTSSDSALAGTDDVVITVNGTGDSQPPTGSIVINGGAAVTNSSNVTLTLAATDDSGTVSQMRFSNNGSSFSAAEAYATTRPGWAMSSSAGTKTVYVQFKDPSGNWSTSVSDTITLDTTAPTISAVTSSSITTSSATIKWTTNEAATSQVDYGTTTAYGPQTPLDATLVTSHTVVLTNLVANTTYNYRARSKDAAGNERLGSNLTFKTLTTTVNQPPVVNAGADKSITLPTTTVSLTATATDDGLPSPPAARTYLWSMVTGPAAVTFSAPTALTTNATFTLAGTYTLRLTANDSALSGSDDVVVTVNPAGTFTTVRINAGGPSFTDSLGQVWSADKNFSGGGVYSTSANIASTVEDTLYRTERTGTTDLPGAAFSYNIPVPSGTYAVTLYFADIYWTTTGKRLFNVSIEGQQVLTNVDIVALVGANTALSYTFQTTVTDGTLNIAFTTLLDNAKVSAIQVVKVP